jgi:glycosyltransferase involved in cell wall biosynthesis
MRLLIVQYGNYPEALESRRRGAPETYRAQYYSLDAIDAVVDGDPCLVLGLDTEPHDLRAGNYHLVGDRFQPSSRGLSHALDVRRSARRILAAAREFDPTHIIVRTPGWVLQHLGRWAVDNHIHLLPVLADLFYPEGVKNRIRNRPLVRLLNHPHIKMVANHNYPACFSMAAAGVDPAKIVPYDWPEIRSPESFPEKNRHGRKGPVRLVFVGQVSAEKGAGDLLRAADELVRSGYDIAVDYFGDGEALGRLGGMRDRMGLGDRIAFHGLTPNQRVMETMTAADLVVVPSRHEYPEGLPCVIYESFETRTPLICSDHPSFLPRLKDGVGCRIFQAGNPHALATAAKGVIDDPDAYASMSKNTAEAWQNIQCPVTFGDMLTQWMAWTRSGGDIPCLAHSLARGPHPGN